jgi:predicted nucleotidyltransferase
VAPGIVRKAAPDNWNSIGHESVVIITHDLAKMKTKSIDLRGQKIRVLALDDLIRMKQASGRPQDREDVKSLEFIKKKAVR